MITSQLSRDFKKDGMLAYVNLIQRKEKELGCDVLTQCVEPFSLVCCASADRHCDAQPKVERCSVHGPHAPDRLVWQLGDLGHGRRLDGALVSCAACRVRSAPRLTHLCRPTQLLSLERLACNDILELDAFLIPQMRLRWMCERAVGGARRRCAPGPPRDTLRPRASSRHCGVVSGVCGDGERVRSAPVVEALLGREDDQSLSACAPHATHLSNDLATEAERSSLERHDIRHEGLSDPAFCLRQQ